MLQFSRRFSSYFRHAGALNFLPFAVSAKNAPMPCDPQKPTVSMISRCLLLRRAQDTQAKRSRKPRPKHGPKKHPTSIKHEDFRTFPGFFCMTTKKRTNFGSRNASPEPPEASRSRPSPPGDLLGVSRRPKEPRRALQEPPKPPQAPPRSVSDRPKRALPERSGRPSGAQLPPKSSPTPPGGHFGPFRARFQTLRGLLR